MVVVAASSWVAASATNSPRLPSRVRATPAIAAPMAVAAVLRLAAVVKTAAIMAGGASRERTQRTAGRSTPSPAPNNANPAAARSGVHEKATSNPAPAIVSRDNGIARSGWRSGRRASASAASNAVVASVAR
jgi:hypothetical protein